jgi:multisubunit Na+/H+ antiporter MnhB subunit
MTMVPVLDAFVAVVVLIVAVWTIASPTTFGAVVGFVSYGLLLALVWVRLGTPDVALTEAAIGSGLTGALLLGAAARLRAADDAGHEKVLVGLGRVLAMAASAMVAGAVAVALASLPDPAPSLAPEAAANAAATGMGNPITNVLMAFRAMDTLLEKVVLLVALVGVWSLARDRAWGGRPRSYGQADPLGALAFLARLLPPVGIIIGLYMLWAGADHPGGAFQGATILAAMWLLVLMAGLGEWPVVAQPWLRGVLIAGPAVFMLVGFGGLVLGKAFLAYPENWAKPVILIIELAMTLTVAVTLGLLVAGPPERRADR